TKNIPMDYKGIMGVPVSFMDKYNPDQFKILGSNRGINQDPNGIYGRGSYLNGKETFKRLRSEERRVGKEYRSSLVDYYSYFQAEDGIRDFHVTGVQTCALPIYEKYSYGL